MRQAEEASGSQDTVKLPPSGENSPGVAPAVEPEPAAKPSGPGKKPRRTVGTSLIALAVHDELAIVPPFPFPRAATFVNETDEKFASGTGVHRSWLQRDGASAIHSAEVRSGFANGTFFVNVVLRVRF